MVDSDGYVAYAIDPFTGVMNTANMNVNGFGLRDGLSRATLFVS